MADPFDPDAAAKEVIATLARIEALHVSHLEWCLTSIRAHAIAGDVSEILDFIDIVRDDDDG